MANRRYLYSSNVVPGPDVKQEMPTLTGISEWNYDIPNIYKLLFPAIQGHANLPF
ncbi:hypothetical protein [Mycoavidus sp. SF9855]|uniref:DUF7822 domain-containing protein n=1 Tax=Mycoavidus sp. SF9855 TaxID=2968475 RepID=UPI00211C7018|nr:hypothetical protein [Mycoavidus sp. SF9855]UUM22292.1 hypothetical protein NQD60_04305 [Mycoavidus sp. SF9855]